jgi:hypothetical protein
MPSESLISPAVSGGGADAFLGSAAGATPYGAALSAAGNALQGAGADTIANESGDVKSAFESAIGTGLKVFNLGTDSGQGSPITAAAPSTGGSAAASGMLPILIAIIGAAVAVVLAVGRKR